MEHSLRRHSGALTGTDYAHSSAPLRHAYT
jgi:hypothetical protein